MSTGAALDVYPPYTLLRTRHGPMLVNGNDTVVGRSLLHYGEYGEPVLELLAALPLGKGNIVEVGAHSGALTVALAAAAPPGTLLTAFEPQRLLFQNLCANLALNGIRNVDAMPWACCAQSQMLSFVAPNYHQPGNFGAVEMQTDRRPAAETVAGVRLDDAMPQGKLGLLKVSAGNMALDVFHGAARLIGLHRPLLYFDADLGESRPQLFEWLLAQRYRPWWHEVPLHQEGNYFKASVDIFLEQHDDVDATLVMVNVLAVPSEAGFEVRHLQPVRGKHDAGPD
jgi:FkbM family methyltransferase